MEFLKLLEGIRTPLGNVFFLICTVGGEEVMLLGLVCLYFWCLDRKMGYRLAFAYLPSALVVETVKLCCRVERPWVRDPSFTAVEQAKKTATGYSFPSGHTQNSTALFGTQAYVSKKLWQKILFFLVIPLVMMSRMYLGVHTPEDVLVSFAISVVIVYLMNVLADKLTLTHKRRVIIACFLCLIALGTMLYTYYLYATGLIGFKETSDSFKGCGAGFGFSICWVLETRYVCFDVKCSSKWKQLLKILVGLAGVMILKEGIKYSFNALIGPNLFTDILRYFLIMVWAMLCMPLIIKKWFQVKE